MVEEWSYRFCLCNYSVFYKMKRHVCQRHSAVVLIPSNPICDILSHKHFLGSVFILSLFAVLLNVHKLAMLVTSTKAFWPILWGLNLSRHTTNDCKTNHMFFGENIQQYLQYSPVGYLVYVLYISQIFTLATKWFSYQGTHFSGPTRSGRSYLCCGTGAQPALTTTIVH